MADASTCREGRWYLYAGELEGVGQLTFIHGGGNEWKPLISREHTYISELHLLWYGDGKPSEAVQKYYDEGGRERQWSP